MLTTTLDGLWVLQVLTGIEVLAPELGLRPHLPSVETRDLALGHPAAAELRDAGVIDGYGAVDAPVIEWLTALSRRDVALLLHAQTPLSGGAAERVLLARFAQWWVALERSGDAVRVSGLGTAGGERSARAVIGSAIHRLCGTMQPAALRPVTLDVDALVSGARSGQNLRGFLVRQGLDGEQIATLAGAADPERCAQASIVAIQSGVDEAPARLHVEASAVSVIDTPQGRLVAEHLEHGGRRWMVIAPGTTTNLTSAVQAMLRRLPAQHDWHSYRKAV